MKKKKKGKKGVMALKQDMSKAYDRLESDVVVGVFEAMGFLPSLVMLIKICIYFISYQILHNSLPGTSFYLENGFPQGYIISSYLFILCVDVLSKMIKKATIGNNIHGISVAMKVSTTSHIFFADGNLFFARTNSKEVDCIMRVLYNYQESSV